MRVNNAPSTVVSMLSWIKNRVTGGSDADDAKPHPATVAYRKPKQMSAPSTPRTPSVPSSAPPSSDSDGPKQTESTEQPQHETAAHEQQQQHAHEQAHEQAQNDSFNSDQMLSSVKATAATACYGAVAAVVIKSIIAYSDKKVNEEFFRLEPEPCNFALDQNLVKQYHHLAAFRAYNQIAYEQSIFAADRLLGIEVALKKGAPVKLTDGTSAKLHFEAAMTHFFAIKSCCTKPEDLAQLQIIKDKLMASLNDHMKEVVRLSDRVLPTHSSFM